MRRPFIVSAALLGLALAQSPFFVQGAFAQGAVVTQSPPAPNAASSAPQPVNSLPRGAATAPVFSPGSAVATTAVPAATPAMSAPAVNTLHPLRQPRRVTRQRAPRHRVVRSAPAAQ